MLFKTNPLLWLSVLATALALASCGDSVATTTDAVVEEEPVVSVTMTPTTSLPPVTLELQCSGSSQSAVSEFEWPETGPASADKAIEGYVEAPELLELRPDWAELRLEMITESGSSANGWYVDENNVVRLVLNAETNGEVWLVAGYQSCSPS